MKPRHTPAPWNVQWSDANGYWIDHDPRSHGDMKTGRKIIATLNASRHDVDRADAQLIAAAPEMLDALMDALRWVEKVAVEHGFAQDTADDIKKLIVKATGDIT